MPSQIATFRRSAAQCFYGITALSLVLVTIVWFRLKADLAMTAFIYLAVIVLLCLFGSYVVSVVFTILSVAARRREMAPKPGLAAAANSSPMAPGPIGEGA
jgi:hypothetical protein